MSGVISQRSHNPFLIAADLIDPPREGTPLTQVAERQWRLWSARARTEQLPPDGDWRTWYVPGGRGSGKTRTGAEALAHWILTSPPGDWAVVAPTYGDARDKCIEGQRSGLLVALGEAVEQWNRSLGEIRVKGGARVHIDGADDGALRIQGLNLRGAWGDEVGLWRQWERAWYESLNYAVRMAPAKIVCTGTPKGRRGLPLVLVDDPAVPVSRLSTRDNADNLDEAAIRDLERRYGGTRLGRQELEGELLDDVEGALWQRAMIPAPQEPPPLERVVVGVDPAGGGPSEVGIVVCGKVGEEYWVLDDLSLSGTPNVWAARVAGGYELHHADRVVGERNYGGEMVEAVLRQAAPELSYKPVMATRGKQQRAEPVAALYEQGKVRHAKAMPELEDQMCSFVPGEGESPDRLDAMVWAMSELLGHTKKPDISPVSVTGHSHWRG